MYTIFLTEIRINKIQNCDWLAAFLVKENHLFLLWFMTLEKALSIKENFFFLRSKVYFDFFSLFIKSFNGLWFRLPTILYKSCYVCDVISFFLQKFLIPVDKKVFWINSLHVRVRNNIVCEKINNILSMRFKNQVKINVDDIIQVLGV